MKTDTYPTYFERYWRLFSLKMNVSNGHHEKEQISATAATTPHEILFELSLRNAILVKEIFQLLQVYLEQ